MPDPTTTPGGRQHLLAIADGEVEQGHRIVVIDQPMTARRWLTPPEAAAAVETDARLAASEDRAQAVEADAEVHQLRAAGDPRVRSKFYGDDVDGAA
jgi:hypothetical protein